MNDFIGPNKAMMRDTSGMIISWFLSFFSQKGLYVTHGQFVAWYALAGR
jgi:hypothetical protein